MNLTTSNPIAPRQASWNAEDENVAEIERRHTKSVKYEMGSLLGSGAWSSVHKVRRLVDKRILAGKKSNCLHELREEARILQGLNHKHILEFVELWYESGVEGSDLLVTEICVEGSLQNIIDHKISILTKVDVAQVALQMGLALQYLHGLKMFHSDVKPRNIFVRRLYPIEVVLGDLADVKGELNPATWGPLGGTPTYYSPEMVKRKHHCGKSDDMWALGTTLLGMVSHWPRIDASDDGERCYAQHCFDHVQLLVELNPGHGIINFIQRLMEWAPEMRATSADCFNMAGELLDKMRKEGKMAEREGGMYGVMGIKPPNGFDALSFW